MCAMIYQILSHSDRTGRIHNGTNLASSDAPYVFNRAALLELLNGSDLMPEFWFFLISKKLIKSKIKSFLILEGKIDLYRSLF